MQCDNIGLSLKVTQHNTDDVYTITKRILN